MDFAGSVTHRRSLHGSTLDSASGPAEHKKINAERIPEFTEEEKAKVWKDAAKAVQTYHDELVEQWQKAMDTLLVYAGLFSAVLTAFNVQSYPLLQPAPTDPTLLVLQQISAQLSSFTVNPSFINSTQPAGSLAQLQAPFRAPLSSMHAVLGQGESDGIGRALQELRGTTETRRHRSLARPVGRAQAKEGECVPTT